MEKTWWFLMDYYSHKIWLPKWLQARICDDLDWRLMGDEAGKRFIPIGKPIEWGEPIVATPEDRARIKERLDE